MKVQEIFPTPIAMIDNFLTTEQKEELASELVDGEISRNSKSNNLMHTGNLFPLDIGLVRVILEQIKPRLIDFGELLLGSQREWLVTELWGNIMFPGGSQPIHNHSNSIISGIIYLTPPSKESSTTFHKNYGSHSFILDDNQNSAYSKFSRKTEQPVVSETTDLILFPSNVMHSVSQNKMPARITVAFNAVPKEVRYGTYGLSLGRLPD